jgi:DNA-binding CsgD family transcriptional regulator
VQTHVSHILAKLGVRSRAEVAHEAAGHRPPVPTTPTASRGR